MNGFGQLTAANTAYDGTGTTLTLYTAGADGGFLEKIRCKALGTNVATVVRIFLNNGSSSGTATNNSLIAEATLPATTASNVAALIPIEVPLNMRLQAGYVINVAIATAVAAGYSFTAESADF